MKMTLVKLKKLNPCRAGLAFANECQGDFEKIWETCDQGDWLIWLLRRTKQIDKPTAVRLAVECARHVLPIFVSKQDDKRPHLALEAAEAWIKDPTPENQELCKKAADAAAA